MTFEELDALVTRLKELEDPQKEAFPSFADTDWRTLSGIVAREIESLHQQLADHIKREVMLRDALEDSHASMLAHDIQRGGDLFGEECRYAEDALAATADLDGLILCHAEPMAWTYAKGPIIDVGAKIPLYRAWEPK